MFKVCIFVVSLAVVVVGLPTSDEKPGYCSMGDGTYIKEGEEGPGPIGKCMRMKCEDATPGHMEISGVGCGTFVPRPSCSLSDYDNTKHYPACCPKEVCPDKIEGNKLD